MGEESIKYQTIGHICTHIGIMCIRIQVFNFLTGECRISSQTAAVWKNPGCSMNLVRIGLENLVDRYRLSSNAELCNTLLIDSHWDIQLLIDLFTELTLTLFDFFLLIFCQLISFLIEKFLQVQVRDVVQCIRLISDCICHRINRRSCYFSSLSLFLLNRCFLNNLNLSRFWFFNCNWYNFRLLNLNYIFSNLYIVFLLSHFRLLLLQYIFRIIMKNIFIVIISTDNTISGVFLPKQVS